MARIMSMFGNVLVNLFQTPETAAEHNYLSGAVDLADLEWRMKEVRRGRFRKPVYMFAA